MNPLVNLVNGHSGNSMATTNEQKGNIIRENDEIFIRSSLVL